METESRPPLEPHIESRLRAIINATKIISTTQFGFDGQIYSVQSDAMIFHSPTGFQSANSVAPSLVVRLAQVLYERAYCSNFQGATAESLAELDKSAGHPTDFAMSAEQVAEFQRGLSSSNAGIDAWDDGWKVHSTIGSGQVVASKGDYTRIFQPGEYLTSAPSTPVLAIGSALRIFAPRESWTAQVGFYYAFGTTFPDAMDDLDIVRLYWNVDAAGCHQLVRQLTVALNRCSIPFKFKCQVNPSGYGRVDGTVLFIARRHFRATIESLRNAYERVQGILAADVPLFTRRLRPGLSVAEDPGTGESFGMHRMKIVAEALFASASAGVHLADEQLGAIRDAFEAAGLSLSQPHLNAHSREKYEFTE